ncbi:MAG: hypothetical protein M3Z04_16920 [Chloroflexota bacterium]|nr:hypothetical protein [Chloroflexota bacterium]
MRARRPPLAEIDTWTLWQAVRRGEWRSVAPWLLLLAGFCAVLGSMISFFWLTAPGDLPGLVGLLLIFALFLFRRLSARAAFAAATMGALLVLAGLVFAAWWLLYAATGNNVWVGIGGVVAQCGLGIALGLAGINRLAATTAPPNPRS